MLFRRSSWLSFGRRPSCGCNFVLRARGFALTTFNPKLPLHDLQKRPQPTYAARITLVLGDRYQQSVIVVVSLHLVVGGLRQPHRPDGRAVRRNHTVSGFQPSYFHALRRHRRGLETPAALPFP